MGLNPASEISKQTIFSHILYKNPDYCQMYMGFSCASSKCMFRSLSQLCDRPAIVQDDFCLRHTLLNAKSLS